MVADDESAPSPSRTKGRHEGHSAAAELGSQTDLFGQLRRRRGQRGWTATPAPGGFAGADDDEPAATINTTPSAADKGHGSAGAQGQERRSLIRSLRAVTGGASNRLPDQKEKIGLMAVCHEQELSVKRQERPFPEEFVLRTCFLFWGIALAASRVSSLDNLIDRVERNRRVRSLANVFPLPALASRPETMPEATLRFSHEPTLAGECRRMPR